MGLIKKEEVAELLNMSYTQLHNAINFLSDFPDYRKIGKIHYYNKKAVLTWIRKHDVEREIEKALKRRYQYYYPQIADKAIEKKKSQEHRQNPLDNRQVVKFLSCGPKKYGASSGNPANRQTVQVKSDWM